MEPRSLSPRELAEALGVSESSVKRWVDAGRIPVSRTAGGHRRILLPDAARFVRTHDLRPARPDLIGISPSRADRALADILIAHAERFEPVAGVLTGAYLDGMLLHALFDGPLAEALRHVGDLYETDESGIAVEHRFMQECLQALGQLRLLQSKKEGGAPVAVGGSPVGDPYQLPSLMAALVLADAGFRDVNLGPEVPGETLVAAADRMRADLVWLSVTTQPTTQAADGMARTARILSESGRVVMVGGRSAAGVTWPGKVRVLGSMEDLHAAAVAAWNDRR